MPTAPRLPARTGRPTLRTPETAATICERLVAGESLRTICADEGMPSPSAVFDWLAADPAFSEQYARAREAQADTLAAEVVQIADDAEATPDGIGKARLQIDARKWYAAKLRPKVYGDAPAAAVAVQINNDTRAAAFRDRA